MEKEAEGTFGVVMYDPVDGPLHLGDRKKRCDAEALRHWIVEDGSISGWPIQVWQSRSDLVECFDIILSRVQIMELP